MVITYPIVCRAIFGYFECREVDGHHYLASDHAVRCYENERWNRYLWVAVGAAVAYPVGVPLAYAIVLGRRRRAGELDSSDARQSYGFIYRTYRNNAYSYALLEMLRRLLLVSFIRVLPFILGEAPIFAATFMYCVSFAFLVVWLVARPLNDDVDNALHVSSLVCTVAVLVWAMSGQCGLGAASGTAYRAGQRLSALRAGFTIALH